MSEAHRKRWLLVAAAACALLFLGDRFILGPLTASWKTRARRITELKTSIHNGQTLLDRGETLKERWSQAQANALPAEAPAAENALLGYVSAWASSSGVTVSALAPRWIEDETLGPRMEIRVSGSGSLSAISRFLYSVESSPAPLRLEVLELRARDDNGRELSVDARISGLTAAVKGGRS